MIVYLVDVCLESDILVLLDLFKERLELVNTRRSFHNQGAKGVEDVLIDLVHKSEVKTTSL